MTAPSKLLVTSVLFVCVAVASAADTVHLLGFVERFCVERPLCFVVDVEAVYSGQVGDQIKVIYDDDSQIYDPENYRVTPVQSNIVEGSHLRLLLAPVDGGFRAEGIWVGD